MSESYHRSAMGLVPYPFFDMSPRRPDEKGGEDYRLHTCLRFEYVWTVLGMADSDRFDLVQSMDMQTGKKRQCEI